MTDIIATGDVKRYSLFSFITIGVLVFGIGGWAVFTELSGAVIAGGTVVVESSAKRVQHQEGGIVAEFDARNDDYVEAGQVLLKLDDTALKAGLAIVNTQLNESLAIEARLAAEIAGEDEITFPAELTAQLADPQVARILEAQRAALRARREVRLGSIAQLNEQVRQLNSQRSGLELQRTSIEEQITVVDSEYERLTGLLKENLIDRGRVNDLIRQQAQLTGQLGSASSSLDQTTATVAEREVMIRQVESEFLARALDDLQVLREKIGELTQQKIAGEDRLRRVVLVAPQAGVVHESIVHTVGGVVAPGETLMMIVPTQDRLVIEVRLNPLDVDKVSVGQKVIIRIPGFNARITPDLPARVKQVAPDLTRDPQTGISYFQARVMLNEDALKLLPSGETLMPGMPAEAYIQTGNRTVLTYLLEPLEEQFRRAMREN
jgi:HlyD family type I secretion membrane fusion protein